MLNIGSATKAPVSSMAKFRHGRRLESAARIFVDAVQMGALRSTRGPYNVMIWEAGVLGVDGAVVDSILDRMSSPTAA